MKKLLVVILTILMLSFCLISCNKECKECEKAGQGLETSIFDKYRMSQHIKNVPLTMEADIKVLPGNDTFRGTIVGNNDNWSKCVCYYIGENGNPQVFFKNTNVHLKGNLYTFDKVDVRTFDYVHLAITIDMTNAKLSCYINGELEQVIENIAITEQYDLIQNFIVVGDTRGGNIDHFRDSIKSLALFSDIRTAEEIKSDYNSLDTTDSELLVAYRFDKCSECMKKDLSANGNDLTYTRLWLSKDEVEPLKDYAYSFAVVGDTQELSDDLPEQMDGLYSWILNNVEPQKIKCVLGLGDITQKSYDYEWVYAKEQIFRMNGRVPYTLVRGNHDKIKGYNTTFVGTEYEKQVDGVMTKGSLTNAYKYLDVGSNKYLILMLDYGPNDDMLSWANDVIASHPDRRVIITTHAYMYRDGTRQSTNDAFPAKTNNGDDIWEKLVKKHENIELVISGHDPSQEIAYRTDKGEKGNTVHQLLIDAQNLDVYLDGVAMVAMFYFSEHGNTIQIRYYSVTKDMYGSETSQFTINLAE